MFRMPLRKKLRRLAAVAAGTSLLAAMGIAATAGTASADTVGNIHSAVTGTMSFAKVNTTVNLAPGIFSAAVDLDTGAVMSVLTLPATTVSVQKFGFTPLSATFELIQNSPALDNVVNGIDTASPSVTLKITSLKVLGLSVPVGGQCQTNPFTITINSQPGYSEADGGPLQATFAIPSFHGCGLSTVLINLTIPGAGNVLNLNFGPVQFDD
jgi:hypothetical protein